MTELVAMETDGNCRLFDLRDCLIELRQKTDKLFTMKKLQSTPEEVATFYKAEVTPLLLNVRRHNRKEKNDLESRNKRTKELHQNLRLLAETCNSLEFEVSCLQNEVSNIPKVKQQLQITNMNGPNSDDNEIFDVDTVFKQDHKSRMRLLDEEQDRRRLLQQKLVHLSDEIDTIERSSNLNNKQLDQVKPFIKQLLDKIGQNISMLSRE